MRVTEKTNTIHYLPQEIKETKLKNKHKLVKKRRR